VCSSHLVPSPSTITEHVIDTTEAQMCAAIAEKKKEAVVSSISPLIQRTSNCGCHLHWMISSELQHAGTTLKLSSPSFTKDSAEMPSPGCKTSYAPRLSYPIHLCFLFKVLDVRSDQIHTGSIMISFFIHILFI
jgi:hypothetical protein